jgi:hypothetical protein
MVSSTFRGEDLHDQGGFSWYDLILYNDDVTLDDYLLSEYSPVDSPIEWFNATYQDENDEFWNSPLAWKDFSSQTFWYKPAKGNWTLLVTNTDKNLANRVTYLKLSLFVAQEYTCHEGCEYCYDFGGCAGDCDYGYDYFSSINCDKEIEHCIEQIGDLCVECQEPDYWGSWDNTFCTQCDKDCESCDQDTL